ncbi:hypothetical protein FJTKL_04757 [Diaporthe vaccinii]|uniref:Uncharacterized protein n=1 Tax=Diaporthe vaccinii TaxID=105482 RepID=A0ABR4F010_9PEZI
MIAATIVKNTFGFGMVFYYTDWTEEHGFIAPLLSLMAITVGFSVLGLAIFIPHGKRFRIATKDSTLHVL